jgi:hypothetical protein
MHLGPLSGRFWSAELTSARLRQRPYAWTFRGLVGHAPGVRLEASRHATSALAGENGAGATGLEPATSGVTGR